MQMQGMSGGSYHGTLSSVDFNLTNETQKAIFLHDLKHLAAAPLEGSQAAEHFWYGVTTLLVVVAAVNRVWVLARRVRKRGPHRPGKLYTAFSTGLATSTALVREASYLQWSPRWLQIPPMGSLWLIAAYFSFLLGLEFNNNHAPGAMYWQLLGTRAGWLATAQIPLLVALAGKFNVIGLFCGVSNYTRLNIYHRWVARGLLLLSTLHFACQNHGWDVYEISLLEWTTDSCPITGIAAYAFVLWMNLTTLAPLRSLCYELFVIQHLITFFGFIIAISYHLQTGTEPSTQRYIYVSAAIWIVTMLLRFCWVGYTNAARPGHARLEAMAGGATRVCITSSHPLRRWSPGAHILLSLPRLAWPLSTHPATVLSTPTSHHGDLILILKARSGFTDRLLRTASRTAPELSSPQPDESLADEHADGDRHPSAYLAWIDGPYPSTVPDLSSFDSVLLIAGGTGVTFTLAQLLHLAHLPRQKTGPLRYVTFIWVVRERQCLSWIQQELQEVLQLQQQQQGDAFHLHVKLFITRDTTSTEWAEEKEEEGEEKEKEEEEDAPIETTNDNPQAGGQPYGSEKPAASRAAAADQLLLTMPGVSVQTGRPTFDAYIEAAVLQAHGEVAVACCGPIALTVAVRQSVVRVSDGLGVSKGSGLPGVMLHVENSA